MARSVPESTEVRFKRYKKADERMELYRPILREAYDFVLPNRQNFYTTTQGTDKTGDKFDSTAPLAVREFANTLLSILMPPYRDWVRMVPGPEIPVQNQEAVQRALQQINRILINALNRSPLSQAAAEAFEDVAISTGILQINEGDDKDPLSFRSVPLGSMVFEEGPEGTLENFWRRWELPGRLIQRMWPGSTLPDNISRQIKDSPDDDVVLIEGTIFYPDEKNDDKYYYYVQVEEGQKDIFTEWREFSPWIAFRMAKSPGEILGRGPVLDVMGDIRTANIISSMTLEATEMGAFGPTLVPSDLVMNPYTIELEPRSVTVVNPGAQLPTTLQYQGNLQFGQISLEQARANIKKALLGNPLPEQPTPNTSATEIAIRQQNLLQARAAEGARLLNEFNSSVVDKTVRILRRKGLIPDVVIDGKEITVKYESPIIDIEGQSDAQAVQLYSQFVANTFGPDGVAIVMNLPETAIKVAEDMKVDLELIKPKDVIEETLKQMQQQAQAEQLQQNAAAAQQLAPENQDVAPEPATA